MTKERLCVLTMGCLDMLCKSVSSYTDVLLVISFISSMVVYLKTPIKHVLFPVYKHENSHSHNEFVSIPRTQNASHIPKTNIGANVMSSFESLCMPFLATNAINLDLSHQLRSTTTILDSASPEYAVPRRASIT